MDFLLLEFLKNIWFIIQIGLILSSGLVEYYILGESYQNIVKNIAENLVDINILYVKLFQAIALNNNYIDEETNQVLLKYTDKAPYSEFDVDWVQLINCMYDFHITSDDLVPINSGMISVVFKCIKDGKPIILKVKRRDIERKLSDGLKRVKFCINLLSLIHPFGFSEISYVINKNMDVIKQQTNFYNEISNMKLFKEKCKYLNYVKIPDVYESVTGEYSNIIAMEFIEGKKFIDISSDEESEKYARLIVKFGLATILNFGVAHGDLHSGNIIFIKNSPEKMDELEVPEYQIGIIDLGIIAILDNDTKNNLIDIFSNIGHETHEKTANKFIKYLISPKNLLDKLDETDKNHIINLVSNMVKTIHENKRANQNMIYNSCKMMNEYFSNNKFLKDLRICLTDEFVRLQLYLAMCHGVTLDLCKDKYVDITQDVLDNMFQKKLMRTLLSMEE